MNAFAAERPIDGAVTPALLAALSTSRLVCLHRHWKWADDAKARFDRQRSGGWEYDDDPQADHLFGAYYQWCTLLCGVGDAVLEHGVPAPFEAVEHDLRACLPVLRAARQVLLVVPIAREPQPRIVDLLRDEEMLRCIGRVHVAIGGALRDEQASRTSGVADDPDW
jgi:hypothetical protein